MRRFSERVQCSLEAAGWYEGRRVDVRKAIMAIESQGFTVSTVAKGIMEEFYGLSIPQNVSFIQDKMLRMFFPEPEDLNRIAPLVGEPLCPVAYGAAGFAFSLPSGRILHVDDAWTAIAFESSIEEYLERVCLNDRPFSTVIRLRHDQKPPDWR